MRVGFILEVRVKEDFEAAFLERYEALHRRVERGLDGHVAHQLARSLDEPGWWLIASQWEDLDLSRAWEQSSEHRALTEPLRECWDEARRRRYGITLESRRR